MCGIVGAVTGFSNGFSWREVDALQDMMYADTLRGWDSTGVFSVNNRHDVHLLKEASPGFRFLSSNDWKTFKYDLSSNGKFFVGHNRAATRGVVTDKNAHPFCIDDKIVLVQNGTYKGSHHHLKNTDVDTEAIAHVLAEEENVEAALQKINAAYCLVWYNVPQKKLHFIRNVERPLWIAECENDTFFFASEPGILDFGLKRREIKLNKPLFLYKENTLATIQQHDNKSYTEEYQEINNTYVSKYQQKHYNSDDEVESYWRNYTNNLGTSNDVWEENRKRVAGAAYRGNNTSYRQYTALELLEQVTDVPRFTQEKARSFDSKFKNGESFVVEPMDYKAANDHQDCSVFYVFAKLLNAEETGEVDPLFYWIVENKDEKDMLSYFDGLFRVTSQYNIMREDNKQWLCAICCKDPQPIQTLPAVTNQQPTIQ